MVLPSEIISEIAQFVTWEGRREFMGISRSCYYLMAKKLTENDIKIRMPQEVAVEWSAPNRFELCIHTESAGVAVPRAMIHLEGALLKVDVYDLADGTDEDPYEELALSRDARILRDTSEFLLSDSIEVRMGDTVVYVSGVVLRTVATVPWELRGGMVTVFDSRQANVAWNVARNNQFRFMIQVDVESAAIANLRVKIQLEGALLKVDVHDWHNNKLEDLAISRHARILQDTSEFLLSDSIEARVGSRGLLCVSGEVVRTTANIPWELRGGRVTLFDARL